MSVNWLQPLRPFVQQLGNIIDALDTDLQGYVNSWLEAHPEATTTVEDDSLTTAKYKDESVTLAKLNDDVLAYIATHGVDTHGYYPYMLVGGADALTSGAPSMSVVYPKIINGDALTAQLIRPNLGNDIIDVPVTLEPAIIGDIEIEPEIEEVQTDDIEEG